MRRAGVRSIVSGVVALAMLGLMLPLVGCQTVKGVGKDVQNVGEAGERAINK